MGRKQDRRGKVVGNILLSIGKLIEEKLRGEYSCLICSCFPTFPPTFALSPDKTIKRKLKLKTFPPVFFFGVKEMYAKV